MDSTHAIGNEIVDYGKYKIVTYALKDGKQGKRCDLVIENILVYEFMKIFSKNIIYEYARHTQSLMARFAIQVVQGYISTRYHCFGCRFRRELHTTTTKWCARKLL